MVLQTPSQEGPGPVKGLDFSEAQCTVAYLHIRLHNSIQSTQEELAPLKGPGQGHLKFPELDDSDSWFDLKNSIFTIGLI